MEMLGMKFASEPYNATLKCLKSFSGSPDFEMPLADNKVASRFYVHNPIRPEINGW